MIEIKNIYKSFDEKVVLNNISSKFQSGKINLIIGKSGSGKTMAIKCMLGLHDLDRGEVIFGNRNFITMSDRDRRDVRKEIGMVFQAGALFDSMSVEDNVMFPLKMSSNMSLFEMKKRVNFCLDRVDLSGVNDLFPSELSGGMQKRVAIARAISLNPKYLFCDEPNSGLDPATSNVIDSLLKEITHEYNITTVINTHDMNSVLQIGDNILFIKNGEKKWEGSNSDLLSSTNKDLDSFLFASKLFVNLKKI